MDGTEVLAREGGDYSDLLWALLGGGGAGNFGIVQRWSSTRSLSARRCCRWRRFGRYRRAPEDTARLLRSWKRVHEGDRNPELGAWLFLCPGDVYEFKFGGVRPGMIWRRRGRSGGSFRSKSACRCWRRAAYSRSTHRTRTTCTGSRRRDKISTGPSTRAK